ncbi:Trans-enoyl reductase lepG [Diaporthe eres]|nr:Trans-enoyl reductase lepG [Diaporthe eres]
MDAATASTYGISAVTAMQALHARHGLPRPGEQLKEKKQPATPAPAIFIYSGSTAAGLFAVRLAKAAGYTIVTTASPHSFDLVRSYGADVIFDYHGPQVVENVVKVYPNISVALDCFSAGKSTDVCDAIIAGQGGEVVVLLPTAKSKNEGVEHELIMSYTLFGLPFQW